MPAFFDLQVAQRFRGGGAPGEFHADFTLGVRPAPRWLLLAQSFNVISEGAGSWGFPSYEYYKLQLSAVYASSRRPCRCRAAASPTYAGRNACRRTA